ncbi:MAG: flagellar hook capping FlgD N-terminal domain-containing protein [Myxococcota bacterium]|nr:flagellar hook capping FlgD N-terminal domain-containing protein [Myxococcota bacterium]
MSTDALSQLTNVNTSAQLPSQGPDAATSELGKDAFLKLLVTQLQYQDPLDPTENEEFVAQLAQFSQVEQLTTANDSLETLYAAMASMNNASMTQLLGKEVLAKGDTFAYGGKGDQALHFDASSTAASASVTVMNADGRVVYSGDLGGLDAGRGSWVWDGKTIGGATAAEGEYSFAITARDRNGDTVAVMEMVRGQIDGMSFETGSPVPSIKGVDIDLGDVLEVFTSDNEDDGEPSA